MTKAMLLCAGLSTRLGPLSADCPKPLLPVCGRSILRYGIHNLVSQGVTEIVINLHHRGDAIREELGDGSELGARIHYSHEDEILGTGGGLKKALPILDSDGRDEPFLSLNGKLIFDVDIRALLDAFQAEKDALGMMVVRAAPNAMKWGAVDVRDDDAGRYVGNILGEGGYMFCGVHVTRPSTVARLPEGEACMVRQGYLPWLQKGERVAAFEHREGYFAEHSTPMRYLQSNLDLLEGAELRHPPGPMRGIDDSATIDPGATIVEPVRIAEGAVVEAGATVGPGVVLGPKAVAAAGSHLQRSVVWSGARAEGTIENAIVTESGPVDAVGADPVDT